MICEQRGWSQAIVAERIGTTELSIHRHLSGGVVWSDQQMERLAVIPVITLR